MPCMCKTLDLNPGTEKEINWGKIQLLGSLLASQAMLLNSFSAGICVN